MNVAKWENWVKTQRMKDILLLECIVLDEKERRINKWYVRGMLK